ncbi:MAG: NADH-quinone oxidoreductase subunit L, partial [Alphaproteobacteria bacterium]
MYSAAIFLPLIGALLAGFFGRWLGDRGAQLVTCGAMLIAAGLAIPIFHEVAIQGHGQVIQVLSWMQSGALEVVWTLKFDTLTAVMVLVVNVVSAMIHIYSIGYMHGDPSVPRFMSYLSLFTFFMLMLVSANDLVQLYFGWEGVGLVSYLLIGFWYDRPSANAAAIKAFLVNRVGDFGFGLGIFGVFYLFGSVYFDVIFASAPEKAGTLLNFLGEDFDALTVLCLLLFVGAMGKSAQLGLHTWLPDAMEGPTPVSALIHAATMVTAGVFMVARLSPLFEYAPIALNVVAIVGASTAFFAATVGLVQNDIKRVIAYSTCSQLGYMFFAAGVSAYAASIFHLMTHAFFKALLFLAAGSVIHAFSDEQDMRKMGGVWKKIPVTYTLMWIGSLALAGVPFFAGYYSKDMILESAYAAHTLVGQYAFWLGAGAAALTAFYSWRLILMTFHGKPRADAHVMEHVHESPKVMLLPLVVLALGAIFTGYAGYEYFVGHGMDAFWRDAILVLPEHSAIRDAHHVPEWVKLLPVAMGVVGIAIAYLFYTI